MAVDPRMDALLIAFYSACEARDYARALCLLPQALAEPTAHFRLEWVSHLIYQGYILPLEHLLFQLLEHRPEDPRLLMLLGMCAYHRGDPERTRFWLNHGLKLDFKQFQAHQLYLWSFLLDARLDFQAQVQPFLDHGRLLEAQCRPETHWPHSPDPERRLRIGYLSSDYYTHSANQMFQALFAGFSRQHFELRAYATLERQDAVTERFARWAGGLYSLAGLSTEAAVARIRADQIDILVDLNGVTFGHRLDIFAHQPAPLQLTGLGFGWTSGLSRMDYLLSDPWLYPAERVALCPEQPLYLSSYFHWQPDPELRELSPERGERLGFPCFGAFHSLFKLNLDTLALWAELLRQRPQAVLLFKERGFDNPACQAYYRLLFKQWGVDPRRLFFAGRTSQREHVRLYQQVDIFLDTFPYQGGISSCEALYMGRPVVALSGGTRAADSLLRQIGRPQWLAHDRREYLEIACALADNPLQLLEERHNLREALLASAICDQARFVRETEAHYRQIWRQWCRARGVNC